MAEDRSSPAVGRPAAAIGYCQLAGTTRQLQHPFRMMRREIAVERQVRANRQQRVVEIGEFVEVRDHENPSLTKRPNVGAHPRRLRRASDAGGLRCSAGLAGIMISPRILPRRSHSDRQGSVSEPRGRVHRQELQAVQSLHGLEDFTNDLVSDLAKTPGGDDREDAFGRVREDSLFVICTEHTQPKMPTARAREAMDLGLPK